VDVDGGRQRFEGRVVAVTGGASGLGEAMCRDFAAEGARVAVVDLREEGARAVAGAAGGHRDGARAYACDVADSGQVEGTFTAIEAGLGPIDVLVNNAGIAVRREEVQDRTLADLEAALSGGERHSLRATSTLDDATWDRVLRVHLYGTFHCSRAVLRGMEERRSGVILNLSSVAALMGLPTAPEYSAAKGGISALTKAMAQEVSGAGIRVNAIAPGWIRTPMTSEEVDPRLMPMLLAQVPMGRMGEPDDVAALALHLCSDEARYTTGQVISPNGGVYR
jgi:3-oxoacyl-[acyl-carrier protein] reductase